MLYYHIYIHWNDEAGARWGEDMDFEVRKSSDCHDRLFFIDNECWIIGQSVKDAGKKPTYLIKIEGYDLFRKVFDDLWNSASRLM
jgi:hypothetical protein